MAWYRGYGTFLLEKGKLILIPESIRSTKPYAEQYRARLPKTCEATVCPLLIKRCKPKNGKSGVPDFLVAPEDEPCLPAWSDEQ